MTFSSVFFQILSYKGKISMAHTVVVRAQWVIFHTLCQVCHVFWQEISTLTIHFSFFISRWFQTRQRKNFLMICWILFQLAIDKLQCVTFLLLFCKKIDYDMFPQPCVFFAQFNFLYFKMVLDQIELFSLICWCCFNFWEIENKISEKL